MVQIQQIIYCLQKTFFFRCHIRFYERIKKETFRFQQVFEQFSIYRYLSSASNMQMGNLRPHAPRSCCRCCFGSQKVNHQNNMEPFIFGSLVVIQLLVCECVCVRRRLAKKSSFSFTLPFHKSRCLPLCRVIHSLLQTY